MKPLKFIQVSAWKKAQSKKKNYDLYADAIAIHPDGFAQGLVHGEHFALHALKSEWPEGKPPAPAEGEVWKLMAVSQFSKYIGLFFTIVPVLPDDKLIPFPALLLGATGEKLKVHKKRIKKRLITVIEE
jgi:hypothetical protein